jgi:hypothetical protein
MALRFSLPSTKIHDAKPHANLRSTALAIDCAQSISAGAPAVSAHLAVVARRAVGGATTPLSRSAGAPAAAPPSSGALPPGARDSSLLDFPEKTKAYLGGFAQVVGAWARGARMALAVLSLSAMAACFNPTFIGEEVARDNHAPVVEVFPPPSNVPVPADLGGDDCKRELSIVAMDDADDDRLTVRFDILRTINDLQRRTLLQVSPPLAPLDGQYPITSNTSLELSEERLGGLTIEDELQLIELRVSDNGFEADENGDPVVGEGGAVFFMSWVIRIGTCPTGGL